MIRIAKSNVPVDQVLKAPLCSAFNGGEISAHARQDRVAVS
jgi:hypothetical protein